MLIGILLVLLYCVITGAVDSGATLMFYFLLYLKPLAIHLGEEMPCFKRKLIKTSKWG